MSNTNEINDNQYNDDEDNEVSYGELLSNLTLSGEIIITIPIEEEIRVKTGLKNLKAKQSTKMKEDGLVPVEETLEFSSVASEDYADCVNLQIILKRKGVVRIKKMIIPDNAL